MNITYTNKHNLHPILKTWLQSDEYSNGSDLFPDKKLMSTTSLIKPIKQQLLSKQVDNLTKDISEFVASRRGTAIHDSIEKALRNDINNLINPTEITFPETRNIVYLEKRYFREINNVVISGQVDQIFNGQLCDIKTTSTFTYTSQNKFEDYKLQGSIYRWLNPELITKSTMLIHYVFSDWKASLAEKAEQQRLENKFSLDNKEQFLYPEASIKTQEIELYSLEETEAYIVKRLNDLEYFESTNVQDMVCTDKELWIPEPKYQYFTKKSNARASKNFDSLIEANAYLGSKGTGFIVEKKDKPKACHYCNAYSICKQRKEFFPD